MRVAVSSTVIFDVPDGELEEVRRRFEVANAWAIGKPMETVNGQLYVMRAIERIDIERRDRLS